MIVSNSDNNGNIDPDDHFFNQVNVTCNYYTIGMYNNIALNNNNFNTTLLNYNIRSFHKNYNQFEAMMETMGEVPEFCVITETWNSANNVDLCKMDGYTGHLHTFRDGRRGGGVSIFCTDKFNMNEITSLSFCKEDIETCVAMVTGQSDSLFIVGIYRPPTGSVEIFLSELESIMLSPLLRNNLIILAGDMNLNLMNYENANVNNYISCLNSYQFLPVISKPTRFAHNDPSINPSTLDHICLNKLIPVLSGIIDSDATDHCPTFIKFNHFCKNTQHDIHTFKFRPFSKSNLDKLVGKLLLIDWDSLLVSNNVNIALDSFLNIINNAFCESFPIKIKQMSQKRFSKPWLTRDIMRMVKLKTDYFRLLKRGLITCRVNNELKNRIGKKINDAKRDFFTNQFNKLRHDAKKTWILLRKLTGHSKSKPNIEKIVYEDIVSTEDLDIAEAFSSHFSSVASRLNDLVPRTTLSPLHNVIPVNQSSLHLYPISENECLKIISNLKLTKTEIDHIPVKTFILIKNYIVYPLCKIINLSLKSGKFPIQFKTARITPIYKKGDTHNPSNYRPISTLPFIGKVFERCIAERLLSYFNNNSIFSKFQFGFQKGLSTYNALEHLTENIYKSINDKSFHISVFVDLSKAFDTVEHSILLEKMELYGVRGVALRLFRCYLQDRKYYVRFGTENSAKKSVSIGVPQGSILGPLLFLIYVNDLPNVSEQLQPIMFADDTTLSCSGPNLDNLIQNLNNELENFTNWSIANKLTINTDKTEMMIFSNRKFNLGENQVCLHSEHVNFQSKCNFLGVLIDDKLSFSFHIRNIIGKLSKNCGILYKIRDLLSIQARLNFYYSLMYPYLTYNIIIWGNTHKTHLNQLEILHKRIIRTICNSNKNDHTEPLFYRLRLLKLIDIYKYFISVHMYNSYNRNQYRVSHSVNTRNRQLAVPVFHRLEGSQHAVSFSGPTIWNTLPLEIRNSDSLNRFKKALKNYFIDSYA